MKRIFINTPLYIKVFASAFVALSGLATGTFYYVGNKMQKAYKNDIMQISKAKEITNAQHRKLNQLRRMTHT